MNSDISLTPISASASESSIQEPSYLIRDPNTPFFAFETNERFTYRINEHLNMHMEKSNIGTAEVFFSLDDQYIHIHEDVMVLEKSIHGNILVENKYEKTEKPLVNIYLVTHYYLHATKSYEIRYKNQVILSLEPCKCWKMIKTKEYIPNQECGCEKETEDKFLGDKESTICKEREKTEDFLESNKEIQTIELPTPSTMSSGPMTSTFSFCFTTPGCEYTHSLTPTIRLHIYRTNHAVALVYFTDEHNQRISITYPDVFTIYTKDVQTQTQIPLQPIEHIYALCCTDDYFLYFNNDKILDIKSKREWDITLV
jgi:hypothetical protein